MCTRLGVPEALHIGQFVDNPESEREDKRADDGDGDRSGFEFHSLSCEFDE